MSSTSDKLVFNNGVKMPFIGLGTWPMKGDEELEQAIDCALKVGYRHIDTAYLYQNESSIGKVLKKWISSGRIAREELFIVSKLPFIGMREEHVGHFLQKSLDALQLDYIDLYLVHSPIGLKYISDDNVVPMNNGKCDIDVTTDHIAIWKAMEKQVDLNKTKAIGLSNFNEQQIQRILNVARIKPANLQIEMHAYFQRRELRDFCNERNISVCAYAPFGSPGREKPYAMWGMKFSYNGVLNDAVVNAIAQRHGKTPGQVLLRFLIQLSVAVVPKSSSPERISSNFDVFDFTLTSEDMSKLSELDKGKDGVSFPSSDLPGFADHPECNC